LDDHASTLPAACREAAWVRKITPEDVHRLSIGVAVRYGVARYTRELANAAPPVVGSSGAQLDQGAALINTDFDQPEGIGSNGVAMGKAVTTSGRGLLLGNPHYPWQGSSRFHLIHTTIPGELDVMGVSLYSTSRVAIGFNKDVAWTHTVSTGTRSTLYALELDSTDATRYRVGSEWRRMTRQLVQVAVRQGDGSVVSRERTVWSTHYGPVVASAQLPWSKTRAFAVRDVNIANTRFWDTYSALNTARSVDDVERAISLQGTSWVNTLAADRHGTAFYGDFGTVPNVDSTQIARCRVRAAGIPPALIIFNGADPSCAWKDDPASAIPGALPASALPRLRRDDVVSNANDSYWLSNPRAPLEGYSPMIGNERAVRSLRTRAGLTFIDEALANGKRVSPDTLQRMLFSQRNFGAELLLDDLLKLCTAPIEAVMLGATSVDITPSCTALAAWDRKELPTSRGAHLWREFWRLAGRAPQVFAVPFDAKDPVHTPRGLAITQPAVRDGLRRALATVQQQFAQLGIAPDATLGSLQYITSGNERIPIPGGDGLTGMWSVISADLKPAGYTPIVAGNSFIQVVGWTKEGVLDARGILTYSQSDNPDSPHAFDMTRLYSRGEWVKLPFTEAQIQAQEVKEQRLIGK
jgi:acyl-homoserine-lactone acylase